MKTIIKKIIEGSIKNIEKKFNKKVVTYVKKFKEFYVAETYHQDYYEKNFIRYLMYIKGLSKRRTIKQNLGMKKIFILTGEPSGDKLASKVIIKLKNSRSDIEYLSVGGEHLNALGIKSLYNLKDITYLGFTSVLFNIFKIKKNK